MDEKLREELGRMLHEEDTRAFPVLGSTWEGLTSRMREADRVAASALYLRGFRDGVAEGREEVLAEQTRERHARAAPCGACNGEGCLRFSPDVDCGACKGTGAVIAPPSVDTSSPRPGKET